MADERSDWSPEQRRWIPTWQKRLLRPIKDVSSQVERFKESVPDYAEKAVQVVGPLLEFNLVIGKFDSRRKSQPMSYADAQKAVENAERHLREWDKFVASSEVQSAIAEANRQIKREKTKARKDRNKLIEDTLRSEEFGRLADRTLSQILRSARSMAIGIEVGAGFSAEDRPLAEQYYLLDWVWGVCLFDSKVKSDIRQYVQQVPTPSISDVILRIVTHLIRDRLSKTMSSNRQLSSSDLQSHLGTYLNGAMSSWVNGFDQFLAETSSPDELRTRLNLFGVDFQPD